MNPLISIIVPVYNTAQYLPRCIDSILSQSFSDFELLLVDDGSTEGARYKLCGDFICTHPNDNGMKMIAEEIYKKL